MPREVPPQANPRLFDRVKKLYGVPEMPVIVADDIAAAIDFLPDIPDWTPPAEDYGVVAPPFPRFFVEAMTHFEAHDGRHPVTLEPFLDDRGKPIHVPAGTSYRGLAFYDINTPELKDKTFYVLHKSRIPADTHWLLAAWGWQWDTITRQVLTWPGPVYIHLSKEGRILDNTREFQIFTAKHPDVVLGIPDAPEFTVMVGLPPMPAETLTNLLPFALKAISAMHRRCEVDEVTPDHKARRQAETHQKLELHKYYVLKVKPTKVTKPEDFRKIGTPAAKREGLREHTVRGHFRYYWPHKPLFGRISGSIFIPAHKRGKPTYGDIDKDYRVSDEPPNRS